MTIIDTHAHLDHLPDCERALQEAFLAGVEGVVAVGVDLPANQRNLEIKRRISSPRIVLSLGIHPGNIVSQEIDLTLAFIREHIQEAAAIGEIGLDYWYQWCRKDDAKKKEQREVFDRQLALAQEFHLPVVIHSRGAWRDCFNMTKAAGISKAVFHWYSGPLDVLNDILAAGFLVSATPSLAYSPPSREAISHAPLERTLIETDTPVYYRENEGSGFSATPKDVFKTLAAYCALKKFDPQAAVVTLNQNARDFFGIH